ncbi:MAG: DUF4197 domain-containing protein, partial [Flavobacteriales bacterium]
MLIYKKTNILVGTIGYFTSCSGLEEATKTADDVMNDSSEGEGEDEDDITEQEAVSGLKEALKVGAKNSASMASKVDGFNKNEAIRIPFPPEVNQVKEKALDLGLDKQVNKFEVRLNRAAEEASKEAAPVFVKAVKNMSVKDAFKILEGSDSAATHYLRKTTSEELRKKFKPIVHEANQEVKLTKYWNPIMKKYNATTALTGKEKVNPDLDKYVTNRALDGLFHLIH